MYRVDFNELDNVSFMAYGSGTYIYSCKYKGQKYAYKLFEDPESIFIPGFEEKIDLIKNKNLKRSIVPSFIVMDQYETGFLTKKLKNGSISNLKDPEDVYYALNDVKTSIIELHENGIIHGDIHDGNILMKKDTRFLHDFDNSQVIGYNNSGFDLSCCSYPAYKFASNKCIVKNLDIFLFNFVTFCELNGLFREMSIKDAYNSACKSISKHEYGVFRSKDSKKLCNGLLKYDADEYLIDTVDLSDIKRYMLRYDIVKKC